MSDPIETAREHLAQYDRWTSTGRKGMSGLLRVLAKDVRALLGLLDEAQAEVERLTEDVYASYGLGYAAGRKAQAHLPDATLSEEERDEILRVPVPTLDSPRRPDGSQWPIIDTVERILATRLAAQPESTMRVEWGVRFPSGVFEGRVPEFLARESVRRYPDRVLFRRTVTSHADIVGPWTEIEASDES